MSPQTTPRAVSESVARCRPVGFISTPARRRARAPREPAGTCGIGLGIFSPTYLQSNRSNRGNMGVRIGWPRARSREVLWMTIDRFAGLALVIVDMQNDFVRVGAPLEVPESRSTIPVHQRLLAACRERGISDIIDEIYPEPGDPIVDKFGYGAFHNTNLDDLLKARHVESVLVTGTVTQICVEETARESFKRGYRTTVVSDAVSTYAPDLQAAVLKNFAHKFGWVSTAKDVIAELESRSPR